MAARFFGFANEISAKSRMRVACRPHGRVGYDVFEPYYTQAERLFHVHGQRGEDPLEPWASAPYPFPAVSHEPKIEELVHNMRGIGLHPFHIPLGILLDEKDGRATPTSPCIRCSFYDGFPCPLNGKADAQVVCVDPMLRNASERHAPNRCIRFEAKDDSVRTGGRCRSRYARGPRGDLFRRHRRRGLRRAVIGAAAVAVGERGAIRTASRTSRARSGATTCGTI